VVNSAPSDPSLPPVGGSVVAPEETLTELNDDLKDGKDEESKLIRKILKLEEIDKNLFRYALNAGSFGKPH
jgi:hypothetical protein